MFPAQPSQPERIIQLLAAQPNSPDVRAQKCLEAVRRALEEFDCELQVNVGFTNGGATPNIIIVPNQRQS